MIARRNPHRFFFYLSGEQMPKIVVIGAGITGVSMRMPFCSVVMMSQYSYGQ